MIIRRYEAMQFIDAAQQAGGGFGPDEFERNETGYNCLAQYLASAITLGAFGKGMSSRPLRGQPGNPDSRGSRSEVAASVGDGAACRSADLGGSFPNALCRIADMDRRSRGRTPLPISTKAATCA